MSEYRVCPHCRKPITDGWIETVEYVVDVRVVRCRDCLHFDSKLDGCWWFAHAERQPDYSWADEPSDVEPDGFCKWGERK